MIPAVEDFTQRLQQQQQQQQQLQHPALSETQELQIELLGKALISPEQLRAQLMVTMRVFQGIGFLGWS